MTPFFKKPDQVTWRVSAKWMVRRHNCTVAGIKSHCGGRCCTTKAFWPPKAYHKDNAAAGSIDVMLTNGIGVKNALYACGHLGPEGCDMGVADKPITCLLYPALVSKNDLLVLHNRATTAYGPCKGNHNHGPLLIDVLEQPLVHLFGQGEYDRVRVDVVSRGQDSHLTLSPNLTAQWLAEREVEKRNDKPIPRRQYSVGCGSGTEG